MERRVHGIADDNLDRFVTALPGKKLADPLHHVPRVEPGGFQIEFPGLDFRGIKNIV